MFLNKSKVVQYKIDKYIAFAVGIQSLLAILQLVLLDVAHMTNQSATIVRVALTVGTMVPAIVISAYRKPLLFAFIYGTILVLLMLTIVFYPSNAEYIYSEATRFLLPVSIPCCLCLSTIHDFSIFEDTLYKISIATAILIIIYCIAFFLGLFYINKYSMAFSYGCLLPMVFLYSKDSLWSKTLAFFLLLVVLAIGSRGAAIVFVIYIVLNTAFFDKKRFTLLICIGVIAVVAFPLFLSFLDSINIHSRTLSLLLSGEAIDHDSGRGRLYGKFLPLIGTTLWGHGMFGDRVLLDGSYCHNFFIELFYDFGIIGGTLICIGLFGWIALVFLRASQQNRMRILLFCLVVFVPLMVSGSFLTNYNLGLLLGVTILVSRENSILSEFNKTNP